MNTQAIEFQRELNAIYEVSKTLAMSLDVAKTFREALNYLSHAYDWRRAFVVLGETDGGLQGLCAVGLTQEEQQRLRYQSGEGIVGRVYANGIQVMVGSRGARRAAGLPFSGPLAGDGLVCLLEGCCH